MKEFIFLIRFGITPLSTEQTTQLQQKWGRLTTRLREEKKFVDGYIFSGDGYTVECNDEKSVSHEIVVENNRCAAGCVVILANDTNEALLIARELPPLEFGGTVEVRERQPTPRPAAVN